jgi:hypothetical protein
MSVVVASSRFRLAPTANIKNVQSNAEKIRRNKAELRRAEPDQANDDAIDRRKNPTLPTTTTY